jgi:hypothetical protein
MNIKYQNSPAKIAKDRATAIRTGPFLFLRLKITPSVTIPLQ